MSNMEVVGLGALNIDNIYQVESVLGDGETAANREQVYRDTDGKELGTFPGGSAANTIYGLAKLGIRTGFIGVVGDDTEGKVSIQDLQTVGVDPQFQGKGYAGKLLRSMFARIDEEGLPCYLETLDEANIQLYEHFGFTVVERSTVPETKLTNWAMLREAQRAPSGP